MWDFENKKNICLDIMNGDELINQLMRIETPYIKYDQVDTTKRKNTASLGYTTRQTIHEFRPNHVTDVIGKIEELMKMGLSIEGIKAKIDDKRGHRVFWRTNEILDQMNHENMLRGVAEKRLALAKSMSRLGNDSPLGELKESNILIDISSNISPTLKSGLKKSKETKKPRKPRKPKKPKKSRKPRKPRKTRKTKKPMKT